MKSMEGKVVLITGASSGIGAVMAARFSEEGAIPVLTARSESKLKESAALVKGKHGIYVMDVTSWESVRTVVESIMNDYGKIDVLINNAGFGVFESFLDCPLDEFEDMMNVNYMGIVRCTKAVLPHMVKARSGHIVNIASMAGKISTAKSSGYCASKHAVLGFTNSLRQELAGTGIKLTAINPGPIETPFFEKADPSGSYVKNIQKYMLQPRVVANEVLDAVKRGVPEKDLPKLFGVGAKLYQMFPRLLDSVFMSLVNKK